MFKKNEKPQTMHDLIREDNAVNDAVQRVEFDEHERVAHMTALNLRMLTQLQDRRDDLDKEINDAIGRREQVETTIDATKASLKVFRNYPGLPDELVARINADLDADVDRIVTAEFSDQLNFEGLAK